MSITFRRLTLATAVILTALPVAASAQVQVVLYGGGEWDTQDQSVYTLGAAAQATRLGLSPTVNVLGYLVDQPTGSTIKAINPSVGVQHRWMQSALQLRVGYAFVDNDTSSSDDGGATIFGGSEDGLTTAAQYTYWGTGVRTAELLANMNWGDQYFWTRARANQRILHTATGGLNLGAEVVAQGNSDNKVFQVGPTAEMSFGTFKVIGVAGYKIRDDLYKNGPYFKAEFVLVR